MSGTKGARSRRLEGGLDALAQQMNASVDFDRRLLDVDVEASRAHARMLARQGVISADDARLIDDGLVAVRADLAEGRAPWDPALEDVHMNVEARLIERIGDAGRRLHTGRSRNDQVATDLRLWAITAGRALHARLGELRAALVRKAAAHVDDLMPGYTHLQRAQPVRIAHHLLAYHEMFERDQGRVEDAVARADVSPLGSGALAGTTFPLDRRGVADDLGFAGVTRNSLDAVGDRDFAIELVGACALVQVHLSRLAEELVLWCSQEFGFARLSDRWCSGSSLMPQKKNPDLAELVRGKVGRVTGAWVTLVTVVKGLPLAYNKDLQETQEPLYDAVETAMASVAVMAGMVADVTFDRERMRAAVGAGHLVATELADYLVGKGCAFRDAHDIAGYLVRVAIERGVELGALSLEELRAADARFGPDVLEWLDAQRAVDRRDLLGAPARSRVIAEIQRLERELGPASSTGGES